MKLKLKKAAVLLGIACLLNTMIAGCGSGSDGKTEDSQGNEVLQEEREKGNYVIAGGDFNHDIAQSKDSFPSGQKTPAWVYQLTDEDLAEGFRFVKAENADEAPTCRGADIPYEKGVTYTVIVDGFLVSDNVEAKARNREEGFLYSDHNPVEMEFVLLEGK